MTDYDTITMARKVLQKRWLAMLIFGICCSFIFCAYKNLKGNFVIQSGDVLLGQQIQLSNYVDRKDNLKYDHLASSETLLYDFYKASQNKFDYNKMLPGWSSKSDLQKIEWLKKHVKINDYGAGNIEFRFDILKSETKNLPYLRENGEQLLDNYVEFLQDKKLIGDYSVKNKMAVYPDSEVVNKKGILFKYGFIGFILGIVLSYTIFFIRELCK